MVDRVEVRGRWSSTSTRSSPTRRSRSWPTCTAVSRPPASACSGPASERAAAIAAKPTLDFLPETAEIRGDKSWRVASAPADINDRRVEITGPTEAKMLINAWNSGARVHLADFEDANAPTWTNLVQGQLNLRDANSHTLDLRPGRRAALRAQRAHGRPVDPARAAGTSTSSTCWSTASRSCRRRCSTSASTSSTTPSRCIAKGSGPYFYLPKTESYLEARLWNDVFNHAAGRARRSRAAPSARPS